MLKTIEFYSEKYSEGDLLDVIEADILLYVNSGELVADWQLERLYNVTKNCEISLNNITTKERNELYEQCEKIAERYTDKLVEDYKEYIEEKRYEI